MSLAPSKNASRCKRYRASLSRDTCLEKERLRKKKQREQLKKNKNVYEQIKLKDRARKRKSKYKNGQKTCTSNSLDQASSSTSTPPVPGASTTSNASPPTNPHDGQASHSHDLALPSGTAPSASTSSPDPVSPCICPFSTKQALYRSMRRAESTLPKDKDQRVFVLSNIVQNLTPSRKSSFLNNIGRKSLSIRKGRPLALNKEHKEFLLNYLEQPGISYTMPGKKDQKYIGKDMSGEKIYKAKHYLLWNLRDLFQMLNRDNDPDAITTSFKSKFNEEIKFSTLYRFVKVEKHILFQQDVPEVSCLCQKCENLELLIHGISINVPDLQLPSNAYDVVHSVTCDISKRSCAYGECINCPQYDSTGLGDHEEINYFQWVSGVDGRRFPEKVQKVCTGEEAGEILDDQIDKIKVHFYLKQNQYKTYQEVKQNLKANEILIHVDFSENYDNKQQHAIQSAYFGYQSFSLYTVCVYHVENDKVKTQSYVLVTESTEHNSIVVFCLNRYLLSMLKSKFSFDTVHFFSDGCAAQFRSKHTFQILTRYDTSVQLYWHYFETSHGKGPVDGVGGTVKSAVYRRVLSKQVIIGSPKQFAEYANSILKGIDVLYVADDHMSVEICTSDSVPIPGTLKVRYVERLVKKDKVLLKFYAISPQGNTSNTADAHNIPFREIDYSVQNSTDSQVDDTTPTTCDKGEPSIPLVVGQWYAVYFECFLYWYIGMIIQLDEITGKAKLDFLQQNGINKNIFNRNTNDESWVDKDDIFYKLTESPSPLSFSRASTLIKSEADFNQVKYTFESRYMH